MAGPESRCGHQPELEATAIYLSSDLRASLSSSSGICVLGHYVSCQYAAYVSYFVPDINIPSMGES